MKKTSIIFKKVGKITKPEYPNQWAEFVSSLKDGEYFQGTFSKPKKPKSNKQLGWLYGKLENGGIYEFLVSEFIKNWGENLYEVEIKGYTIETKTNVTNVDIMMKFLYCKKLGIKEFNKTNASTESLSDYIKFLDEFSINNFGYRLPEPKRKEN